MSIAKWDPPVALSFIETRFVKRIKTVEGTDLQCCDLGSRSEDTAVQVRSVVDAC
jgi:hypothetical protein